MHPASDPMVTAEIAAAVDAFEQEVALADAEVAEMQAQLARDQAKPIDPQIEQTLRRAARNPEAPDALRRLAKRVSDGSLDWSEVMSGSSADPDVQQFRTQALATARAQFAPPEDQDKDASTEPESGRRR